MRRVVSLVAACALLLPAAVAPARAQIAPQEITVNMLQGEPNQIDPNRTSFATEAAVVRQAFQTLLRFDATLAPQPAAAERYDISPDGLVYTFYLRPDGRWSDGAPVTAHHFEYSWKRLLDPRTAADYASLFADAGIVGAAEFNAGTGTVDAVGIRALDDLTFQVTLSHPFGPFPNLAALWVAPPLRPDVIEADPVGWTQNPSTYIVNGPFRMAEWVHQDHITLEPNPFYTPTALWPRPTLTKITFLMVTNGEADYAAFLNGERDWTLVPDSVVPVAMGDPTLSPQVRQYNELTTFWVHMNTARPPLHQLSVRRALNKAIDRVALIRDIASGVGMPATSILPPGMPGFQEGLGQELDFDPDGGRALMAEAGYPNGQGFRRIVYKFSGTSANQRRAEFLQAQWKANLNVDVELQPMEPSAYQAAFRNKDFDLAFTGWGADYPDPQNWFATNFSCDGGNNKTNYCSQEFDSLVEQADRGVFLEERLPLYRQAQTQLIQDAPIMPLYVRGRTVIVKPWITMTDGNPLLITPKDDYPGSYFLDMVTVQPH